MEVPPTVDALATMLATLTEGGVGVVLLPQVPATVALATTTAKARIRAVNRCIEWRESVEYSIPQAAVESAPAERPTPPEQVRSRFVQPRAAMSARILEPFERRLGGAAPASPAAR
jgi:hypothetical protein